MTAGFVRQETATEFWTLSCN